MKIVRGASLSAMLQYYASTERYNSDLNTVLPLGA